MEHSVPVATVVTDEEVSPFFKQDYPETQSAAGGTKAASAGSAEAGGDNVAEQTARMAQVIALGAGIKALAVKANPFAGVGNASEAKLKLLREAKDLFNPTAFSKPKDRAEAMTRASANWNNFRMSYTGFYGLTLVYYVLTSPFILIELSLIAAFWVVMFKLNGADDVVTVGQYKFGKKEKYTVLGGFSVLVVIFGGLISTFVSVLLVASIVVGLHATFRAPVERDPLDDLEASAEPPAFVVPA